MSRAPAGDHGSPLTAEAGAIKLNVKQGVILAGLGVGVLSFDATLLRLADTSAWNAAFWRGVFIFIALLAYGALSQQLHRWHSLFRYGRKGLLVCSLYGFNIALFVFAVTYTSVANTVVILCFTPFFAALFSWLMLREKIDASTWLTLLIAALGVIIVFLGESGNSALLGDCLALLLSASAGFMFTLLRGLPDFPRIPAVATGALFSALMLLPFASVLSVSAQSLGWLALMGLVQKPLASVLMLTATRYIPSAEVSVFAVLQSLLAPMWAWLFVDERVPEFTFWGGGVVLAVVLFHSLWQVRKQRRRLRANEQSFNDEP